MWNHSSYLSRVLVTVGLQRASQEWWGSCLAVGKPGTCGSVEEAVNWGLDGGEIGGTWERLNVNGRGTTGVSPTKEKVLNKINSAEKLGKKGQWHPWENCLRSLRGQTSDPKERRSTWHPLQMKSEASFTKMFPWEPWGCHLLSG